MRLTNLTVGREAMGRTLEDLYVHRLRLDDSHALVDALRALLLDEASILVEIAHDGQIPHLGVVRMCLKARQLASQMNGGLALYLVGDHYSAEMRPRNLYLGLPLRGIDADHVKTPLTVSVGKHQRHVPFMWLPPPSETALTSLEERSEAWLQHNASFAGHPGASEVTVGRLRAEFEGFRESARLTRSFGDWLIRIQVLWLDALSDNRSNRLAVLPMSAIAEWVPDILAEVANSWMFERASVSSEGPASGFWVYCPGCRRRLRAAWRDGSFEAHCTHCEQDVRARWPEDASRVMPGIEAFEIALFHAGVSGWIVGSHADYIPVIERKYLHQFGRRAPPSFLLSSVPRFFGLGEPAAGHGRARLPRALLEVNPRLLGQALEAPWDDDPVIRSELL